MECGNQSFSCHSGLSSSCRGWADRYVVGVPLPLSFNINSNIVVLGKKVGLETIVRHPDGEVLMAFEKFLFMSGSMELVDALALHEGMVNALHASIHSF